MLNLCLVVFMVWLGNIMYENINTINNFIFFSINSYVLNGIGAEGSTFKKWDYD